MDKFTQKLRKVLGLTYAKFVINYFTDLFETMSIQSILSGPKPL